MNEQARTPMTIATKRRFTGVYPVPGMITRFTQAYAICSTLTSTWRLRTGCNGRQTRKYNCVFDDFPIARQNEAAGAADATAQVRAAGWDFWRQVKVGATGGPR